MNAAAFTSLLGYMIICSFTPGPGNILALNTISTYGWKRSRSLILGICLGICCCSNYVYYCTLSAKSAFYACA